MEPRDHNGHRAAAARCRLIALAAPLACAGCGAFGSWGVERFEYETLGRIDLVSDDVLAVEVDEASVRTDFEELLVEAEVANLGDEPLAVEEVSVAFADVRLGWDRYCVRRGDYDCSSGGRALEIAPGERLDTYVYFELADAASEKRARDIHRYVVTFHYAADGRARDLALSLVRDE